MKMECLYFHHNFLFEDVVSTFCFFIASEKHFGPDAAFGSAMRGHVALCDLSPKQGILSSPVQFPSRSFSLSLDETVAISTNFYSRKSFTNSSMKSSIG